MPSIDLSLDAPALAQYVSRQLSNFFPDRDVPPGEISGVLPHVLQRVEHCFSHVNNKYFFDGSQVHFNHLHSDQYATFLYYLANSLWKVEGHRELAGKVYYLNKALHSLEIYYEIELPEVFLLAHPVGTVLGRATYGNYLVLYQGCTVGGNQKLEYPVLGEGVALFGRASVVGRCNVGDDSLISAGSLLIDTDSPPHHVAFGSHPHVQFKPTSKSVKERYFRIP